VNDPNRDVAWPAGLDSDLSAYLWAQDALMADEEPIGTGPAGGLVSLAFLRGALARKALIWCTIAVLGLLIGTALYVRYPPAYHAETSVLLVDSENQDPSVEVQTDQTLAESEPVAALVVQQLRLPQSAASFQSAYTVTPITDTVLQFNLGAPSSAAAVQRASALATAFLQYRAKYAQTQEQEQLAELQQQYNTAHQQLLSLDAQIGQLPTTKLTQAQQTQLDDLQTQLADQKQIMQYVTATEATAKTSTGAMVSGSYVLDPATPITRSKSKSAAVYAAGGLFVGLLVGMGIVVIGALLSNRLRRRDDVAAALGAPVRLSVGTLRLPRWLPARPRQRAKQARAMRRFVDYLQSAVPGSSRGPATLAVVAVDDVEPVASAVASLARARARDGRRVVVADLASGAPLARLLGAGNPGVHNVSQDGEQLVVVVPERDDVAPVGPVRGAGARTIWAQPDEALATASSSADLVLSLVTLTPAVGADHLPTWASDAVAVVTVGRSSGEKIRSVGELIRVAGTRLDSAVMIGADSNDDSLGKVDPAHPFHAGAGAPLVPERGGKSVSADGFDRSE
jgi:capsular polysaccharide biosynthesis protein